MNTITVENKGLHLIVRFNNGAPPPHGFLQRYRVARKAPRLHHHH